MSMTPNAAPPKAQSTRFVSQLTVLIQCGWIYVLEQVNANHILTQTHNLQSGEFSNYL